MKRTNFYLILILIFTILSMSIISYLSVHTTLVSIDHHVEFGKILLGVFFLSNLLLFVNELVIPNFNSFKHFPTGLLITSLASILILSIFHKQVGIAATGLFVVCALIYCIAHGRFYLPNKVYVFVLIYALLQLIGTIGTTKGFHFPEMSYSFYLIPLSFYCFRIEKPILLQLMKFFFRAILVYMAFILIFWHFNMQHMNIPLVDWMTRKLNYNDLEAYYWVNSWTHYMHPSYISLVLFPALISGLYLEYKKDDSSRISKFELLVFVIFSLATQVAMQSRIGTVCVLFILLLSFFYYLKLKTKIFKWSLVATMVLAGIVLVISYSHIDGFVTDPARKMYSTLAFNYIKSHPCKGVGYHQQAMALTEQQEIMKNDTPLVSDVKTYTHNQFLGDTLQFGVIGLIVLINLLLGLVRYSIRSRSFLLQQLLSVYFIFMLIEEPLYVQEGITRFMIFLAFFIHLSESETPIKSFVLWNWFPKRKQSQ